jgi:hypothetical protein
MKLIGKYAFEENLLVSLSFLPGKKIEIGKGAFMTNYLKILSLPSRVEEIGDEAFADNHLESLRIEYGIKKIGNKAFFDNLLTSLDVPYGIETIGRDAFRKNKITALKIGGPAIIDSGAFFENPLKNITLHTLIDYSPFEGDGKDAKFSIGKVRIFNECRNVRGIDWKTRIICKSHKDVSLRDVKWRGN